MQDVWMRVCVCGGVMFLYSGKKSVEVTVRVRLQPTPATVLFSFVKYSCNICIYSIKFAHA